MFVDLPFISIHLHYRFTIRCSFMPARLRYIYFYVMFAAYAFFYDFGCSVVYYNDLVSFLK